MNKLHENGYFIDGGIGPDDDELPETCPKCKVKTEFGYGLAGGGCGAYCECPKCGEFWKQQEE